MCRGNCDSATYGGDISQAAPCPFPLPHLRQQKCRFAEDCRSRFPTDSNTLKSLRIQDCKEQCGSLLSLSGTPRMRRGRGPNVQAPEGATEPQAGFDCLRDSIIRGLIICDSWRIQRCQNLGSHLSKPPDFGGSVPSRHPRTGCSEWVHPPCEFLIESSE
jgi:hypothetical protein